MGERDKKFKPDDLFLRNTLPGAEEGIPDYVEPPEEGEAVPALLLRWCAVARRPSCAA